ncbi:hypothetical protein [Baaleninema sp.]|uniref:hypothetical protein n=1 Tax=Baaleninema sp. TaxID=3101197 RepID=UPI003D0220D6
MQDILFRLRSTILTSLVSFALPWLVFGAAFASLLSLSYIPTVAPVGQEGVRLFVWFLKVFGEGSPLEALLWMGSACSFVAVLFDVFAATRTSYNTQA